MPITKEQVEKNARLGRLGLTDDEKTRFQTELDSIVDFVNTLEPIEIEAVPPTDHVAEKRNVYRPDQVEPCPEVTELIKLSPHRDRYTAPSVRTLWKTA